MDDLGRQAYVGLYGKEPAERISVSYHGKFTAYNANIRRSRGGIVFNLSRKLSTCEPEIQIGIMQVLLNKLYKTKRTTHEIEMYQSFLKHLSNVAPVTQIDPDLRESFSRVNDRYFAGMMTTPNLVWGNHNTHLLGTYTYATDTIMITRALAHAPDDVLDYVMYHEMLHKKHKFSCGSGRTRSHTKAFRDEEAQYHVRDAEALLHRFLRQRHTKPRESTFLQRVLGLR